MNVDLKKKRGDNMDLFIKFVHFFMCYKCIKSGLFISRFSKSNDSASDWVPKKPDRDIPTKISLTILEMNISLTFGTFAGRL